MEFNWQEALMIWVALILAIWLAPGLWNTTVGTWVPSLAV